MVSSSSDIDGLRSYAAEEARRPEQYRVPLIALLLALMAGYLLAAMRLPVPTWAQLAIGGSLVGASVLPRGATGWALLFLPGTTLLAWVWAGTQQITPPPIWDTLPPREVVATGEVVEMFKSSVYPDRQYALIEFTKVDSVVSEIEGQRAFCSLLFDEDHPMLERGAHYRVRGALYPVEPESGDDFTSFLKASGAFYRLRQAWALEETRPPPFWLRPLANLKRQWSTWLLDAPAERQAQAHLLGAMLLGERTLLSGGQRQIFLYSGTMHLFAISGLHVMIVALTLQMLLQFLPMPRRLAFAFILVLLALYVGATGFSPSAMRAFSMMAFYWLAGILGRAPRPLPAVLASAVVVLLVEPSQLFSAGFQLSYSVVLSILLFGLPMAREILRRWPLFVFVLEDDRTRAQRCLVAFRQRLVESLCISFSATIGSAPLIVLHFGVWTPGAVVLNAILVPMASTVVAVGVLIILSGTFGIGGLGAFFAHGAWLVLFAMEWMVRRAETIPGIYSERDWISPHCAYTTLVLYLAALFGLHEEGIARRFQPAIRFGLVAMLVLGSLWLFSVPA